MRESNPKALRNNKPSNGVRPVRVYKPGGRSKITNGRSLLRNVDGRLFWCRRLRDLQALLISDLGGDENVSAAERAIVRRACVLQVELELREQQFALGDVEDHKLEQYSRIAGNMRRLLESLGLKRRAKPVPDLYRDVLPALASKHANEVDHDPA
jgi:hypothetical protein